MAKQPSNHNKPWTSGDNQTLRQFANQNTPTRVVGLKMGRTEQAVRSHAADLGFSLKPTNQSPYGSKGR